jgi:hypothetical protein
LKEGCERELLPTTENKLVFCNYFIHGRKNYRIYRKRKGGREIGGVMDRRIERKRALGRKGYFWIYNTFRIIYGDLNVEIFFL